MIEWLTDWFNNIYLYFFNKSGKVIFVGLDNAGKSTLLHRIINGTLASLPPTPQPVHDTATINGMNLTLFDLGGHNQARKVWNDYLPSCDGILFLVDAADTERLGEAKQVLDTVLKNPDLERTPILVLGNKIDIPAAVSEEQLREALGLQESKTTGNKPKSQVSRVIEVKMCSVVKNSGIKEAFQWMYPHI